MSGKLKRSTLQKLQVNTMKKQGKRKKNEKKSYVTNSPQSLQQRVVTLNSGVG